jgi:hypothetical protein
LHLSVEARGPPPLSLSLWPSRRQPLGGEQCCRRDLRGGAQAGAGQETSASSPHHCVQAKGCVARAAGPSSPRPLLSHSHPAHAEHSQDPKRRLTAVPWAWAHAPAPRVPSNWGLCVQRASGSMPKVHGHVARTAEHTNAHPLTPAAETPAESPIRRRAWGRAGRQRPRMHPVPHPGPTGSVMQRPHHARSRRALLPPPPPRPPAIAGRCNNPRAARPSPPRQRQQQQQQQWPQPQHPTPTSAACQPPSRPPPPHCPRPPPYPCRCTSARLGRPTLRSTGRRRRGSCSRAFFTW